MVRKLTKRRCSSEVRTHVEAWEKWRADSMAAFPSNDERARQMHLNFSLDCVTYERQFGKRWSRQVRDEFFDVASNIERYERTDW